MLLLALKGITAGLAVLYLPQSNTGQLRKINLFFWQEESNSAGLKNRRNILILSLKYLTGGDVHCCVIISGQSLLEASASAIAADRVRVRAGLWGLRCTKRHWGRFSPSTSVSLANHHSTNFSIIIITQGWHNRPIGSRSAEWTQVDSTPHYTN
jgi:hypothetical protein